MLNTKTSISDEQQKILLNLAGQQKDETPPWGNRLGLFVEKLRLIKGLTREQLADQLMISTNYIYLIEKGQRRPSMKVLNKIADYFSISLVDLLGDDPFLQDVQEVASKYDIDKIISALENIKKGKSPMNSENESLKIQNFKEIDCIPCL